MRTVTFIFILGTCCADLSSAQSTKQVYPDKPVTIFSDGYPGLVKTWTNYTSQAYRITQPTTQSNLLFLFDRIDMQPEDVLSVCTVQEYRRCAPELSEGGNCFCKVRIRYSVDVLSVEWNITKGDPIVFFMARYGTYSTLPRDPVGYARGGYRTTVRVKDPQREFFECGSTTTLPDLSLTTDRPAPIYFVSQGFPKSTDIYYYDCVMKVLGTDGIRITFLTLDVTYNDTVTISGTSINGTQVTYNQTYEGFLYFRNNATISFNVLPSGAMKRFAIYVEPFRVVAPSCPFLPKTFSNTEFDIITAGFSTTNYDDNLNCQWKMTGLKPNAQLVLVGRSVNLEDADQLHAWDNFSFGERITDWDPTSAIFYYSHPNITNAEFSLMTDGLESLVGVNAHVHILDCSNTQSQHSMVSGQTLPLTIPGNNSKTYCQEVLYKSSVDVPQELALTVSLSLVDIQDFSNFTISATGKMLEITELTGTQLVFSGYSNYEISFLAQKFVNYKLYKGIGMILSAGPVPIENRSVCDSMEVIESSSKLSDYQEYSMSSCGGRKLVVYVIADQVSTGVISLFDGDFDSSSPRNITLGEPIVLSEQISLRVSTVFMRQQKFTIVISDRFLDNGGICGGVVKYDPQPGPQALPIHYPCMAVLYGTFDHMNISSGSMELYDGFGMKDASRKIIGGSNSLNGTNLQSPLRQHVFTMRTLEGYKGNIVAKAIDANNRSSTVRIEEEKQSYYIYFSLLQHSEKGSSGQWDLMCNISQFLQSRPVEVFLELMSPLGEDDVLYVDGIYYRRSDGLVKREISPESVIKYHYERYNYDSMLFARMYATFIVFNSTTGYPTVPTTSVKSTSTSATTVTTIPSSTTSKTTSVPTTTPSSGTNVTTTTQVVEHKKGFSEAPGYLLVTTVFIALLSI